MLPLGDVALLMTRTYDPANSYSNDLPALVDKLLALMGEQGDVRGVTFARTPRMVQRSLKSFL